MKSIIEDGNFNTQMKASDWRYSAGIVGLIKYFNFLADRNYEQQSDLYRIEEDFINYSSEAITEERYLFFVEHYFEEQMHHRFIEKILCGDEITEEQVKTINEKLKANSIFKKVFDKLKFDGDNRQEILEAIEKNRLLLIKETYRNGKSLYSNFSNVNSLLNDAGSICRMVNYNIDTGKKSKSVSFGWDYKTFAFSDEIEFDFIPFAFSKSYEAFFINNNYSVAELFQTNSLISDSDSPRKTLFWDLENSANYIDFDVEVVTKSRDKDYFESLYIRKEAIEIFQLIEDYRAINIRYKLAENYYVDFEKEVTDKILNNVKLDPLIELLLKSKLNYSYNIRELIGLNILIYGGEKMDSKMKSAYASAKSVVARIPENKVSSYKQKLISAITFKDYDRFCEILLQLSEYSEVFFDFAYDLFEDFDKNKNLAYTFINSLNSQLNKDNGGKK